MLHYGCRVDRGRKGFLLGAAAYALWGAFPLYWPLLEPAGAVELLAHRVTWSAVVMVVVVLVVGRRRQLHAALTNPRQRALLALAAVTVTLNWGTYIYGVISNQVVETSLGYFINPLVTVLAGVLLLGERLRRWQWAALGLAAVAVLGLTVDYGHPPWIALTLAFSFALYGLLKKQSQVGAIEGLTVETLVLAPVAVGFLVLIEVTRSGQAFSEGPGHLALLASSGAATALPLVCFGGAAVRVSLTTLGLLQYIAPTLQFLIGVFVQGEPMPDARWFGFGLIWVALAIFSFDSWRARQTPQIQVDASAA